MVKNVQNGVLTLTKSTVFPQDVTISPISSLSKASVHLVNIYEEAEGGYSGVGSNVCIRAYLTSVSNLRIDGTIYTGTNSVSINAQWEVIEYL